MVRREPRARHAVDLVEAAYRLDGEDGAWLADALAIADRDIAIDRGTYAFTCRIVNGAFEIGPAYVERDLDPRFSAVIADMNKNAPSQIMEVLARSACVCGGVADLLGPDHPSTRQLRAHGRTAGIADAFSVFAQDGEGFAVDLTAPAGGAVSVHPRVAGIWRRIGLHLAAAMRLRRRLRDGRGALDALLTPDGQVAHAEAVAKPRTARDALVLAVRRMERARASRERGDPERALELWRGLVAGEWSLVDRWDGDGRRYVAAYRNRPENADPRALTALESSVLRYAALGASNKEIAFALGVAVGSVGSSISQLLRKLRCRRRSDLLALADPSRWLALRIAMDDGEVGVLSMPLRAPAALRARLTPAERDIARQLVAGASNAAIARERRTSQHTVANQLRAMFEKLGVRSRTELVRALTSG